MQYTWKEQNNLRCDVHMYPKKPNADFNFCDYNFWGA
jgi:hypothetical protein